MKVALLNPCYWPEVRRGSERLVHDLALGLVHAGHRARIITSHRGRPSRAIEDGITVERSWRPPERPLRRRGMHPFLTHLPATGLALRRGSDDVVHAFYPTDAVAAVRARRRSGAPVVMTWAGLADRTAIGAWWHGPAIALRATREADLVLSLSRSARDSLWRWLRVESTVVPPGVDLSAFSPGGSRAAAPTLLCTAALSDKRKRADLLLAAFARLRSQRHDAQLVLQRPRDAAAAAELARRDGVVLADLDGHDALLDAYRSAWATVLPSRGEAFGLVVAESLACGTPAVASADAGSREVLEGGDGVGVLFDCDDPAQLASAMDAALELGADPAAQARCRDHAAAFDQGRAVARHLDLYRGLIANAA